MFEDEKHTKYIDAAKEVLNNEIAGLNSILQNSLDDNFVSAVDKILDTKGRVIVSGMGKSGHIAKKIAATLASTGTPAIFVHPGEASHGDMGMVQKEDIVISISDSGGTSEMKDLLFYCKKFGIPVVGMARKADSMLIQNSTIPLVLERVAEGNPVNSPMTSMVMILAYGHAIAAALIVARNFSNEDYKIYHPGGKLGAALIKVSEIMTTGDGLPLVKEDTTMSEVLNEITSKNLGCTGIVSNENKLLGIITDGDIRRAIQKHGNIMDLKAKDIMVSNPKRISESALAIEAVKVMNAGREGTKNKGISTLFIIKEGSDDEVVGILHINDCVRVGLV